ncbi:TetR/AcrR family transcriptional regulator [Amycolatopsis pigmentata]|uniref:TetR/AcrR family transcriptional regulator n=1 Tax=Amycolatopsis pigmentata TaxID=450801 RepID=A0ABW5FN94_9PSEU
MVETGTAGRVASAALKILLDEGASAVTMRRVAADAGVTTMATYRHYPNRETLLRAVAEEAFAELGRKWGRRGGRAFRGRFFGLFDDFLDFALGKPNLYAFLITDRREGARSFPEQADSPAFAPVVEVVEQGMREGVLRRDDPVEVALALTMPVLGLVQLYLGGRFSLSEKDFRALCRRTVERILDGLHA